jgi:hypothetical protein
MRLKDDYDECILLQAIQNPFVETVVKSPYQNSHFNPDVCKVQKSFKAATKRMPTCCHLVVYCTGEQPLYSNMCCSSRRQDVT